MEELGLAVAFTKHVPIPKIMCHASVTGSRNARRGRLQTFLAEMHFHNSLCCLQAPLKTAVCRTLMETDEVGISNCVLAISMTFFSKKLIMPGFLRTGAN